MEARNEADLIWYFGVATTLFTRSLEGARLERAASMGYDSDGNRIPSPSEWTSVQWELAQRKLEYGLDARPRQAARGEEPGYEPDHHTLQRYARVSRSLLQCSPAQREALEGYYGEAGARWDRQGLVLGRLLPVMALTRSGKALLAARHRRLRARDEGSLEERLATECQLQVTAPRPERKLALQAAEHQARVLLADACARYCDA